MTDDQTGKGLEVEDEAAALILLLDVYGGSPLRWPPERRAAAEALLLREDAVGDKARRAAAEARALDRLLDEPQPVNATRTAALADRIAASTRRAPASVIALDAARRQAGARGSGRPAAKGNWMAAGLLAASLLMGVFAGATGVGGPTLQDAASALGGFVEQLALGPIDDSSMPDEDVL
jgi:hypothetical protein